jgi:cell division protein FtsZ
VIYDVVDPDANIIVGAVVDDAIEGEIHVTVIATGFESGGSYRPERTSVSYSTGFTQVPEERGAKIPPFLLNRQHRSE